MRVMLGLNLRLRFDSALVQFNSCCIARGNRLQLVFNQSATGSIIVAYRSLAVFYLDPRTTLNMAEALAGQMNYLYS
jgi:hypothetical protein